MMCFLSPNKMTTNTSDIVYAVGAVAVMGAVVYAFSSPPKKEPVGFQVCTASGSCSDPTFKAGDFSGDITDPNYIPTNKDLGKITVDMAEGFSQNLENATDFLSGVINNVNPDGSYGCMRTSDMTDPRCIDPAHTAGSTTAVPPNLFAKFNDYITSLQNPDIQSLADGCFTNVVIDTGDAVQSMTACPNGRLCAQYKNASNECAIYGGVNQSGKSVTVIKGGGWDKLADAENNVYQNLGVANYADALSDIDYTQFGAVADYSAVGVTKPIVAPPPAPTAWIPTWWAGNPAKCTGSANITKAQWEAMSPVVQNAIMMNFRTGILNFQGLCINWQ